MIINKITFPRYSGIKCNMMPFIQGDSSSLPKEYQTYSTIINDNFLEKGEIGFLTIDEKFVKGGTSQRGFNSMGINRNVHIEVGRNNQNNRWGSGSSNGWGGNNRVLLDDSTQVLIANSLSNTCRYWDVLEMSDTDNGDLSHIIEKFPEETGILLQNGELAKISIFTPHECLNQEEDNYRQFFRIVGKGVYGREDYFTINPLMN